MTDSTKQTLSNDAGMTPRSGDIGGVETGVAMRILFAHAAPRRTRARSSHRPDCIEEILRFLTNGRDIRQSQMLPTNGFATYNDLRTRSRRWNLPEIIADIVQLTEIAR